MEARNRHLSDWFARVRTGQIKLPRFQRYEAWGHKEITELLSTVLRGLPAGATLVLEVGNEEPFHSRFLQSAPHGVERVVEHLLDGQQRLTALWRSLHDNYPERTFMVRVVPDGDDEGADPPLTVLSQARWVRGGVRYPVWCDDPRQMLSRGYVPVRLLNPEDSAGVREWADAAAGNDLAKSRDIETMLTELRGRVSSYNVPYLSLPASTPKDVALDVFMKMNTSSVRLTSFDIVVAQLEEATGQSLHDLVDDLRVAAPGVTRYREHVGGLVLDIASMREDRAPTQASYQRLDLGRLQSEWSTLIAGVRWAVNLLEDESIFDSERLPSITVLPVLAALREHMPTGLDRAGNARSLVSAYLWRSFLTPRYEQSAATRSLQDLRGLREAVANDVPLSQVNAPIFDTEATPLPTISDLLAARWPKSRDILARGVLAAALRAGGQDIADGQPARPATLKEREYHHLFPDSLLTKIGELPESSSSRAVNCALITWSTNRNISNKSPMQYLEERVNGSHLGKDAIRARLGSHLVPFATLAGAGPYRQGEGARLRADYQAFCEDRAGLMLPFIDDLCHGRAPRRAD